MQHLSTVDPADKRWADPGMRLPTEEASLVKLTLAWAINAVYGSQYRKAHGLPNRPISARPLFSASRRATGEVNEGGG